MTGFLVAASTYGQGEINFANTSTTLLMTNGCGQTGPGIGPTSVGFRIGLYTAPFGTLNESLFTLGAVTTNGPALGRFDGGTLRFNGTSFLPSVPPGTPISFQIKAWPIAAGASYAAAVVSGFNMVGKSTIGFVVPSSPGTSNSPSLMGNDYGQVPAFTLFMEALFGPLVVSMSLVAPTLLLSPT
jgi:hypothetical protein